jgi:hypothetical protein
MTVTALGSLSVGEAVPGASTAIAAGTLGINSALPDILSRIEALLAFHPQPVDFLEMQSLAEQTVLSIKAGITAGLPVPSIAAQIAQIAALVAELQTQLVSINAQLSILTALQPQLLAAGIAAYAFDGTRSNLGSELAAAIGPGSMHANALALVVTDPTAWTALSAIVKVSA